MITPMLTPMIILFSRVSCRYACLSMMPAADDILRHDAARYAALWCQRLRLRYAKDKDELRRHMPMHAARLQRADARYERCWLRHIDDADDWCRIERCATALDYEAMMPPQSLRWYFTMMLPHCFSRQRHYAMLRWYADDDDAIDDADVFITPASAPRAPVCATADAMPSAPDMMRKMMMPWCHYDTAPLMLMPPMMMRRRGFTFLMFDAAFIDWCRCWWYSRCVRCHDFSTMMFVLLSESDCYGDDWCLIADDHDICYLSDVYRCLMMRDTRRCWYARARWWWAAWWALPKDADDDDESLIILRAAPRDDATHAAARWWDAAYAIAVYLFMLELYVYAIMLRCWWFAMMILLRCRRWCFTPCWVRAPPFICWWYLRDMPRYACLPRRRRTPRWCRCMPIRRYADARYYLRRAMMIFDDADAYLLERDAASAMMSDADKEAMSASWGARWARTWWCAAMILFSAEIFTPIFFLIIVYDTPLCVYADWGRLRCWWADMPSLRLPYTICVYMMIIWWWCLRFVVILRTFTLMPPILLESEMSAMMLIWRALMRWLCLIKDCLRWLLPTFRLILPIFLPSMMFRVYERTSFFFFFFTPAWYVLFAISRRFDDAGLRCYAFRRRYDYLYDADDAPRLRYATMMMVCLLLRRCAMPLFSFDAAAAYARYWCRRWCLSDEGRLMLDEAIFIYVTMMSWYVELLFCFFFDCLSDDVAMIFTPWWPLVDADYAATRKDDDDDGHVCPRRWCWFTPMPMLPPMPMMPLYADYADYAWARACYDATPQPRWWW